MNIEPPIALGTGASSGIGEATAQRLALDVTSDTSVEAAVNEMMRLEGRIDLLVNNAGVGVAPAGLNLDAPAASTPRVATKHSARGNI